MREQAVTETVMSLERHITVSVEKLLTIPLDIVFYVVSAFETFLSEALLSAGRPTPSQCAVCPSVSPAFLELCSAPCLAASNSSRISLLKFSACWWNLKNEASVVALALHWTPTGQSPPPLHLSSTKTLHADVLTPTLPALQTLQLTHRVKELREKEVTLRKETETYRDQLTKVCHEKEALEDQLQRAVEQRDQAITDTAWFSLSPSALSKNACLFLAGVAVSCAWQHFDLPQLFWGGTAT